MTVEEALVKYYGERAQYSGGKLYKIGDRRVEYSGGKLYKVGNERIEFSGGRLYSLGGNRVRYFGSEIYTPVGDQQSAIKGVISFMGEDDCYILNMGTATQLCLLEDGFVSGDFESRPFFGGKTLCTVTGLLGGRYIATKSDEELVNELYENYLSAMKRLPKKDVLVATGGVVKHREQLIERVVEKFGINCILNDECDALFGLKNISREI